MAGRDDVRLEDVVADAELAGGAGALDGDLAGGRLDLADRIVGPRRLRADRE